MRIALAGNPNSGKTTLFNELTKINQKVGNWPGVTVEKKVGKYHLDKSIEIVDLPGVYSLNPISDDEKVTLNFLQNEKPDTIINVIDSSNLERALLLTLQLLETDIHVVIALNMEDELKSHGLSLNIEAIKTELKCPVIQISARKNKNLEDLIKLACSINQSNSEFDTIDANQTNLISENIDANQAASKFEIKDQTDNQKSEYLQQNTNTINSNQRFEIKNSNQRFESLGDTSEQKSEYRQQYVSQHIDKFRISTQSKIARRSSVIDSIVMNRWLAFPIFAGVIFIMFFVSIQTVGQYSIDFMEWLFFDTIGAGVQNGLQNIGSPEWVTSLSVDGIINGVGTVFSFVPQIIIVFLFITFLEGCGYMSRVAIIMDGFFRKLGLSGKSFIPMIIGCGCSVPAIMSAKTIEGDIERKTTIMLTPFVPCSAKLPVFALMAGAIFPGNPFVAPSMYFLGIAMVIVGGLLIKAVTHTKAKSDVFVMELPHYRLPKLKNVSLELLEKVKGFLVTACKIIIPFVIILWFLQTFSFSMQVVDVEQSMLADIGRSIAWIFAPLGFGNWQSAVAIITGILAKETVVASLGVIFSRDLNTELASIFTPQSAYAFMAFILLSAPCVSALAATRREMGSKKWMWLTVGFQCGMGYIVALVINQFGNMVAYHRQALISTIAILVIASIFALWIKGYIKNRKNPSGCAKGCSGCSKKNTCSTQSEVSTSQDPNKLYTCNSNININQTSNNIISSNQTSNNQDRLYVYQDEATNSCAITSESSGCGGCKGCSQNSEESVVVKTSEENSTLKFNISETPLVSEK